MTEGDQTVLKGFREFIARGNIIDLATAVVIGAAFTGLVTAFTKSVVEPLVSRIGASPNSDHGFLRIPLGNDTFVDFNPVVTAALNSQGAAFKRMLLPDRRRGRLLRDRRALQEAEVPRCQCGGRRH